MKLVKVSIEGRVQGVAYRASAKIQADRLGLNGFVRNEADGSVYIEAEGQEEVLEKFVLWCHSGPRHARVESVTCEYDMPHGHKGFNIL